MDKFKRSLNGYNIEEVNAFIERRLCVYLRDASPNAVRQHRLQAARERSWGPEARGRDKAATAEA